jgi:hypothetical protein
MARFFGTLQGGRGEATRLGHASSGLRATAASWSGKVCVQAYADEPRNGGDDDFVRISAEQHGSSSNPTGTFFDGTFEELGTLINWWRNRDQINAVMALLSSDELDAASIRAVREG